MSNNHQDTKYQDSETSIRPFHIDIPQQDIDDLRARLAHTRWPSQLPGGDWSRGIPVSYLKELVEYWQNEYDWREYEQKLNAFPQFITDIEGQQIHFLHVRSPEPNAVPLIMTHSWPNSIVESMNIIGPLTNPRAYGGGPSIAFHIVAPSLPGFALGVSHGGGSVFRRIAEAKNNIIHWSNRECGSHMVAMADPESLIEDIRAFFSKLTR
ncbi:epoxide hydrolase N-terminal domain-containing protein [Paenibacillus sp. MDMC362]|uniref:epoxide hydrolase N-terminal domain-containing protein n=1 Tax=Paenibacillus sp. MDMC362 TaxID=2977365 RepID=UPI000DC32FB5|nr:epoxide hydrolase N-terminal domain-containing protein [Paenibacillus sp. MDMC362]RAR42294.1 hypothetical protein DP091_20010 [Paenibacillus sp. MDMC362]